MSADARKSAGEFSHGLDFSSKVKKQYKPMMKSYSWESMDWLTKKDPIKSTLSWTKPIKVIIKTEKLIAQPIRVNTICGMALELKD